MSHQIPTVRVRNPAEPGGYIIINESDLTDEHKIFEEPAPEGDGGVTSDAAENPRGRRKAVSEG